MFDFPFSSDSYGYFNRICYLLLGTTGFSYDLIILMFLMMISLLVFVFVTTEVAF